MFYSIIQQVVRKSPAYYVMYVALQADNNWKLISYPYYVKAQVPGNSTFFRHIDLNIPTLVADKRGHSLIQGSLSLDDEYKDDCTEIAARHASSPGCLVGRRGEQR